MFLLSVIFQALGKDKNKKKSKEKITGGQRPLTSTCWLSHRIFCIFVANGIRTYALSLMSPSLTTTPHYHLCLYYISVSHILCQIMGKFII
jgi:hypothetical protein